MDPQNSSQPNYQTGSPLDPVQPTVPPPPPPEISLRTMNSDLQSIQEQGGGVPAPQTISPGELSERGVSGVSGMTPENQSSSPDMFGETVAPVAPHKSRFWFWLIMLLIVLAVGAVAYYAYTTYFAPLASLDNVQPITATGPVKPSPTAVPANPAPTIDLASLKQALSQEAEQPQPADTIQEIQLVNDTDQKIPFVSLLTVILPELNRPELTQVLRSNFEEAVSAYLYYDDNGVWPMYRVARKANAPLNIVSLLAELAAIENAGIANFYLKPPGSAAEFRSGQMNGQPTRYAVFPEPGASFNYAIIDDQLILSTSYQGLKQLLAS